MSPAPFESIPQPRALFVSPTYRFYAGPLLSIEPHRSSAPCIVASWDGDFSIEANGQRHCGPAFYLAPGLRRAADFGNRLPLVLYVEPGSVACARLRAAFGMLNAAGEPIALNPEPWRALAGRIMAAQRAEEITATIDAALGMVLPELAPPLDGRILALLAHLHGEKVNLPQLSASRLRHLCAEQIGVPPHRYDIWLRLCQALRAAMRGASLTAGAVEAGFADSAHFTRTFRGAYGIAPSMSLESVLSGVRIDMQAFERPFPFFR